MSLEPMGCACATRQTHPWVYAFAEMTLCDTSGGGGGGPVSSFNSLGSYQAPRYHMRTMLRARNLLSGSDCTLSMIACGALRLSLTMVKSFSKAPGCFSLTSLK